MRECGKRGVSGCLGSHLGRIGAMVWQEGGVVVGPPVVSRGEFPQEVWRGVCGGFGQRSWHGRRRQ